jgi:hypothetical protein
VRRLVAEDKRDVDDIPLAWFVVEWVGDEQPERKVFDTYPALVDHVRRRSQQPGVRLFVFWGAIAHITKGEYKFLVHPSGERVPLFRVPSPLEMEFDETGEFTDEPDSPVGEVTELKLGRGQSLPMTSGKDDEEDSGFLDANYDEYEADDYAGYDDEEPRELDDEDDD